MNIIGFEVFVFINTYVFTILFFFCKRVGKKVLLDIIYLNEFKNYFKYILHFDSCW